MQPTSPNDGESLCREILAEARAAAERLILQARQEGESWLATITATEEKTRQDRLHMAQQEWTRRKDRMLAALPVEREKLRAARIETLLQNIHDEIRQRLLAREGFDYQETLMASAAYALNRMAGKEFLVALSPADYSAFGATLADSICRHTHKTGLQLHIVSDPQISESGLFIRDSAGRQEWDNRLSARLERLWPTLRLQLASLIPHAIKGDDKGGTA